jgi:hypothetical protein
MLMEINSAFQGGGYVKTTLLGLYYELEIETCFIWNRRFCRISYFNRNSNMDFGKIPRKSLAFRYLHKGAPFDRACCGCRVNAFARQEDENDEKITTVPDAIPSTGLYEKCVNKTKYSL